MRSALTIKLLLCASLASLMPIKSYAQPVLKIGEKPPKVVLSGDSGGQINSAAWTSETVIGKVWILFYVDPDEKDSNEALEKALKAANFPRDSFGSIGIINMAASWIPNTLIASALAEKQEKFPEVVYVKDLKKSLVKEWGLKDDSYVTLVFNKAGHLLLHLDGTLKPAEINQVIDTIKKNI